MTDLKNNLEEFCSCNYFTKNGEVIHSVTCKKSSFFNHEIRFGFAEVGLEEIKKDILNLEQELQKTRERLEKAESILKVSVDINISGWQTYRMANQYFKDKDKQGE